MTSEELNRNYDQHVDDDIKAVAEDEGQDIGGRVEGLSSMERAADKRLEEGAESLPRRLTRKILGKPAQRAIDLGPEYANIDGSKAQEIADSIEKERLAARNAIVDGGAQNKPAATTPAPAPAPAKPSLGNGDTVVNGGKGETMFGKYKRVVDQKTGATKFINTETGKEETPQSMQMQALMNKGVSSLVLSHAGKTWDDAIKQQDDAKFQQMMDSTRRALEEQKRGAAERRARTMQRRIDAGGAFGAALSTLTGEIARGEDGSIFGKDGKPIDKRIRVSSDGKHIYLMGQAEPGALRAANESRRANGSASDYKAVMAYRELDRNGNPLKNADGTERPPMIAVTDQPDGDAKTQKRFRTMSSGDVARKLLDAWKSQGRGEDDAKSAIITDVFGGLDPLGWGKTLKQGESGNWHTDVARINADAKVKAAELAAGAKTDTAKIYSDGKIGVANANNKAMLEKTRMQIASYAEKNASQERIAQSKADAAKWIEGLRSKTALSKAQMDNDAKTNIATIKTEAEKAVSEGKLDAYMYGKELDYDAKIEAVKASNMRDAAKNAVIERIAAEKNAAMLTMAEMRNAVAEDNIDLGWFKAETAANQGQQKLDNDKAAKDANREIRLAIAKINAMAKGGSGGGKTVSQSDLKRVQEIQKTIDGGNLTSENKKKLRDEANSIVSKYDSANQTTIKPRDNGGDETNAGSEPPDGKRTIVKDGVSYHWGKSKNGGWKYFPDKK